MNFVTANTLSATLWPAKGMTRNIALAIAGSLALWASAKLSVPFFPVPMTMQTFMVLAIGAAFGWRLGAATVILYLVEGATGLPVFSNSPERGIGLAYMAGPTGGYLVGFVLAAMTSGWLAEKGADRNVFAMFCAMLLGALVIYLPGILWLSGFTGMEKAISLGFVPFVLADIFKAGLAAAIFPAIWSLMSSKA